MIGVTDTVREEKPVKCVCPVAKERGVRCRTHPFKEITTGPQDHNAAALFYLLGPRTYQYASQGGTILQKVVGEKKTRGVLSV
ncbi:hypothetical protein BaRGS_00023513 [Batillaria attramentaria]|uniref:Uncharacterized protein n=1 Tax=Batillaria attramentaria TaxID=370345 RepID=A0ABD0KDZ3_9CAEN